MENLDYRKKIKVIQKKLNPKKNKIQKNKMVDLNIKQQLLGMLLLLETKHQHLNLQQIDKKGLFRPIETNIPKKT